MVKQSKPLVEKPRSSMIKLRFIILKYKSIEEQQIVQEMKPFVGIR
jgi:hypothetical protein